MSGNKQSEMRRRMVGRTWIYMGKEIVIKDLNQLEADLFAVVTAGRTIRVSSAELRKDFLPVSTQKEREERIALYTGMQVESSGMSSLADKLMKNIEEIEKDEKFIPKAKAINDQAKTIISLKKLQLEVLKTAVALRER